MNKTKTITRSASVTLDALAERLERRANKFSGKEREFIEVRGARLTLKILADELRGCRRGC